MKSVFFALSPGWRVRFRRGISGGRGYMPDTQVVPGPSMSTSATGSRPRTYPSPASTSHVRVQTGLSSSSTSETQWKFEKNSFPAGNVRVLVSPPCT